MLIKNDVVFNSLMRHTRNYEALFLSEFDEKFTIIFTNNNKFGKHKRRKNNKWIRTSSIKSVSQYLRALYHASFMVNPKCNRGKYLNKCAYAWKFVLENTKVTPEKKHYKMMKNHLLQSLDFVKKEIKLHQDIKIVYDANCVELDLKPIYILDLSREKKRFKLPEENEIFYSFVQSLHDKIKEMEINEIGEAINNGHAKT